MTRAADIFSSDGPIAAKLPSYELRDSQIVMAKAVENSVEKGGVLLAEAGTGTGKTLSYLVPLIQSDSTAIISTGTKTLQEQIFFKDMEFLSQVFGRELGAVCLKGQNNYLCLRRFEDFERSPRVLTERPEKIEELKNWVETTTTGDRMELVGLADDDPIWREICSTPDTRIGPKCPYASSCFFANARRQAMQAKLVIVNHHLYFADLSTRQSGSSILPPHDIVVFDEAHLIEDTATEFFSISISSAKIDRILGDAITAVGAAKLQDDSAEQRRPRYVETARKIMRAFFDRFKGPMGRVRLVPEDIDEKDTEDYYRLDSALLAVEQSLKPLEGRDPSVDHATSRVTELREELATVILKTKKGFVHWTENRKRSTILGASPIDISEIIRQGVFFSIPTVVLSSATLSTVGDFTYLKNRLGLDFDADELSLKSPFDYSRQARIYLPMDLPDPRNPDFQTKASEKSAKLIDLTSGGTLLLCTSIQNMRAIHDFLESRISFPLMLQGQAPRSTLLKRFLEDRSSVLCATASFWQGVDIPGDALRLLIIDKLPFASPGDPLVAARIADLQDKGGKPFMEYQVPQAALTLKQGAGRLIRTASDKGILAILDRRLHTMSYSKAFLGSLPECPTIFDFNELDEWWSMTAENVTDF